MNTLVALLLGFAVLAAQALHGGAFFPALAWPAFGLVAVAGAAAFFAAFRSENPPSPLALIVGCGGAGCLVVLGMSHGEAFLGRLDAAALLAGLGAFLVAATFPDGKTRMVFLGVLIAGLILQAAIGALQISSQGEYSVPHWFSLALQGVYEGKFPARMRGTLLNPNQLAWFAGCMVIFCTTLAIWGRMSWLPRFGAGLAAMLAAVMVVLTASRGGIVSLGVGLGGVLVLSVISAGVLARWTAGAGRILAGSVIALVFLGGVVFVAISGSWAAQGRMETFELQKDLRSQLFSEGWRMFQLAPLWGNGPGAFAFLARRFRDGDQFADPIYGHNDWLQLIVEYGIAGGGVFLLGLIFLMFGGVFRLARLVRGLREGQVLAFSNRMAILLGALGATLAFVAQSFVDFNLRIPANALLAGSVLGLLTQPGKRYAWQLRVGRTVNVLSLLGAAAGLAWMISLYARGDYRELEADNARLKREWGRAIAESTEGLESDPGNPRLWLVLARSQFAQSAEGVTRGTDGRVHELLVIDEPPDADREKRMRLEEALSGYRKLMEIFPMERSVFAESSKVLSMAGRHAEAVDAAMEAVRLDPQHGYSYLALGDAVLDAGDPDRAWRVYSIGAAEPGGQQNAVRSRDLKESIEAEKGKR